MRKIQMIAILVAIFTFSVVSSAFADSDHFNGPDISGNVHLEITTGNIFNSALGEDSSASVNVGSILSGNLKGNIDMLINTGDIVNIAGEKDSNATVRVGVIGK